MAEHKAGTSTNKGKGKAKIPVYTSSCLHCKMDTHEADSCPFIYSACKRDNCEGIRKIITSNTKDNDGRKFLICQFSKCRGFQWLDEAISEVEKSNQLPKQHVIDGCFQCGDKGHWESNCPWTKLKCKHGCLGYRKLGISQKKATDGWKFLKCKSCKDFGWLAEAMVESEPNPVPDEVLFGKLSLGVCNYHGFKCK